MFISSWSVENINTYGELLSGDTHGIIFLYNGQYGVVTDSNGLYYMRARYYNVDIMFHLVKISPIRGKTGTTRFNLNGEVWIDGKW